jgi:ribosomal protein L40E
MLWVDGRRFNRYARPADASWMSTTIICRACGATAASSAEWCGQCFAELPREHAPAPLQMLLRPQAPPKVEATPPAVYSRWRSSDTSFGPIGRALLTIGLVLALIVGEPILRGFILMSVGFDVPGSGFLILYLGVAIPAGLYLASRVWRRVRIT